MLFEHGIEMYGDEVRKLYAWLVRATSDDEDSVLKLTEALLDRVDEMGPLKRGVVALAFLFATEVVISEDWGEILALTQRLERGTEDSVSVGDIAKMIRERG